MQNLSKQAKDNLTGLCVVAITMDDETVKDDDQNGGSCAGSLLLDQLPQQQVPLSIEEGTYNIIDWLNV